MRRRGHLPGHAPFNSGSTVLPHRILRRDRLNQSPAGIDLVPVAFALASGYFAFISRRYAGKVSLKRDHQGFY